MGGKEIKRAMGQSGGVRQSVETRNPFPDFVKTETEFLHWTYACFGPFFPTIRELFFPVRVSGWCEDERVNDGCFFLGAASGPVVPFGYLPLDINALSTNTLRVTRILMITKMDLYLMFDHGTSWSEPFCKTGFLL